MVRLIIPAVLHGGLAASIAIDGTSSATEYVLPTADTQVPGWLVERLYHTEPILCPWLADASQPDDDCRSRIAEISGMRDAISVCESPFKRSDRVIGHRGAPLVAPEESEASWAIAAQSGAGVLECDVSVTKDLDFVCRHGTCDLATTTNLIADHPELNKKCTTPFVPGSGVSPKCCTFDFTMDELAQLCAVMDSEGGNASATEAKGWWTGPPGFRSNGVAQQRCHRIVPYGDYLALMKRSGIHIIPELKDTATHGVTDFLGHHGLTYKDLADKLADRLEDAGFGSSDSGLMSTMQTFDRRVALHWKQTRPQLRVLYLWGATPPLCKPSDCGTQEVLDELNEAGVDVFAPNMNLLIAPGPRRSIVGSDLAKKLKSMNVKEIGSWSLERQGCGGAYSEEAPQGMAPCGDKSSSYYGNVEGVSTFQHEDVLRVADALFREVGIASLFSDWPATVSTYLNCIGATTLV